MEEEILAAIALAMDDLVEFKKLYFSPTGKPGVKWKELAPSTRRAKRQKYPQNELAFNKRTGALQDSLQWKINEVEDGYEVYIECHLPNVEGKLSEDEVIGHLRFDCGGGRDFLVIDDEEIKMIVASLKKALT